MATSSSDGSCTAPADFQLSSDLEDASNRLSANLLKCPLCHSSRRIFHCRQCVQSGDFTHSTSVYSERFAEKQMRLLRLKAARAQLEEKCVKALERRKQRDKLICDINTSKERVRLLQSLVNETRQSIHKGNQRLNILKDGNSQLVQRLPRHEERIDKLHYYVSGLKVKQEKQQEAVERKREQLKKVIRTSAKQLTQYIFPLSRVQPNKSLCSSENSDSTTADNNVTSEIAEATSTSYVRGRWISDKENSLEICHCIVKPTLPGSGDYSAYSLWVAANKDGVPGANKENAMHNPAYNISAALTHATQLVNVLASYVNIKLPYKLTCGEFCGHEMSDQKFARKVARLNSNVLHLCFTQNTNVAVLHPTHTLQNLMHLLNTEISDLGRIGPMETDPAIIAQLHNQLVPDLENSDDSGSDEEDACAGWEAVPNNPCPEMIETNPGTTITQQSSSTQAHQSVAGGLVTSAAASIASILRVWTNK